MCPAFLRSTRSACPCERVSITLHYVNFSRIRAKSIVLLYLLKKTLSKIGENLNNSIYFLSLSLLAQLFHHYPILAILTFPLSNPTTTHLNSFNLATKSKYLQRFGLLMTTKVFFFFSFRFATTNNTKSHNTLHSTDRCCLCCVSLSHCKQRFASFSSQRY